MGERSGYAHGIPSWVDLATNDTNGGEAFYRALFGWEATAVPAGDQPSTYTMFTKNGKAVAGMAEIQSDSDMPPVWSTYVAVDDIEAVLEKVPVAGGSVVVPATQVGETGSMAFIADPTGAHIGLWQAGTHTGAQLVNEHGTLTWNELLVDDTDAAGRFYVDVFGYRPEVTDTPTGPYTTFWASGNVEGHAASGMMARSPEMGEFPNYWGVYFSVDDCDAAAATAAANGGAVLAEPFDVPEVGRIAVVQDPQGAVFSLMTYETPID